MGGGISIRNTLLTIRSMSKAHFHPDSSRSALDCRYDVRAQQEVSLRRMVPSQSCWMVPAVTHRELRLDPAVLALEVSSGCCASRLSSTLRCIE